MNTELPTQTDTANKLILLKQHLDQILTDPRFQTFKDELFIFEEFLSEKDISLNQVYSAVKNLQKKTESASP